MKTVAVSQVSGLKYQMKIDGVTHSVICDLDTASGGNDGGLDPKQLVLGGLGSCMAMNGDDGGRPQEVGHPVAQHHAHANG